MSERLFPITLRKLEELKSTPEWFHIHTWKFRICVMKISTIDENLIKVSDDEGTTQMLLSYPMVDDVWDQGDTKVVHVTPTSLAEFGDNTVLYMHGSELGSFNEYERQLFQKETSFYNRWKENNSPLFSSLAISSSYKRKRPIIS